MCTSFYQYKTISDKLTPIELQRAKPVNNYNGGIIYWSFNADQCCSMSFRSAYCNFSVRNRYYWIGTV